MNTLRSAVLLSLPFLSLSLAQDATHAEMLFKQVWECREKTRAVNAEVAEATAGTQMKQWAAQQKSRELAKPYDAQRVEMLQTRLDQQRQHIARLEAELVAANIKSPEERAAKKLEATAEAEEARQANAEARAPFREMQDALRDESSEVSAMLAEFLEPMALVPKELGVAEASVSVNAGSATVNFVWQDADGKRLARAYLNLGRPRYNAQEKAKLVNKYPVYSWSPRNAWFLVGNVSVGVTIQKQEWQGKEKVLELIPQLLDLEAIAALPALPESKQPVAGRWPGAGMQPGMLRQRGMLRQSTILKRPGATKQPGAGKVAQ